MIIVAGPPGSGKSTSFPVSAFGVDSFNADDRAAELNDGSYVRISRSIREQVNREFEDFVARQIGRQNSFAIETTLRSPITFDQAHSAKAAGFFVEMRYLGVDEFSTNLKRVEIRADKGGHSAPENVLRSIHEASLLNLRRAIREMDLLRIYDNSNWGGIPILLLESSSGIIRYQSEPVPPWLVSALADPKQP